MSTIIINNRKNKYRYDVVNFYFQLLSYVHVYCILRYVQNQKKTKNQLQIKINYNKYITFKMFCLLVYIFAMMQKTIYNASLEDI